MKLRSFPLFSTESSSTSEITVVLSNSADTVRLVSNFLICLFRKKAYLFKDMGLRVVLSETSNGEMDLEPDYFSFANAGVNRYFLRLPVEEEEQIWGGGEQVRKILY